MICRFVIRVNLKLLHVVAAESTPCFYRAVPVQALIHQQSSNAENPNGWIALGSEAPV